MIDMVLNTPLLKSDYIVTLEIVSKYRFWD